MDLRKCENLPGKTPNDEFYKSARKIYKVPKSAPVTYNLQQLRDILQMSTYAVKKLIEANNIPTLPCGKGKILVLRTTFDEFLETQYGLPLH